MAKADSDWNSVIPYPWSPDQGDGNYRNPIICADYSDPDVIRSGDDFYLTASSFNCTPGLPILHSRDLVNWTIINHALKNLPGEQYQSVQPGCGVWAPAIREHDGRFYIFFPTPDEGIYVVSADHPEKEWSQPHLVQGGKGLIDPCPLWDDDGKAYLVHAYAKSRAGIKDKLRVRPMAPDASALLGDGQIVFDDGAHNPTTEGPKFYKHGAYYYILAPAGGVPTGWQLALRSQNVYGPYEQKIVLQRGSTPINGPHQGGLVDSPDGAWWFVHFQEMLPYGRIVHLQPVNWQDGWPLMGNSLEPVAVFRKPVADRPRQIPQTSDEFDQGSLGLQWQWHANHMDSWHSLTAWDGWLRLSAVFSRDNDLAKTPNLLMQKFPARSFVVQARLDLSGLSQGGRGGMVIMGLKHAALVLARDGLSHHLILVVDGNETAIADVPATSIDLHLQVHDGGSCSFGYAIEDGELQALTQTFQAKEGQWIGAKVGIFCTSAAADDKGYCGFHFFQFSTLNV
jgi:beta-xylosidase